MALFRRREDPHALVVRMTGSKMGDQVLLIGSGHGGRSAAIAAPVGLSGRAVAVAFDQATADRVSRGADSAGVIIEVLHETSVTLPVENGSFHLAVVDDTSGLFTSLRAEDRVLLVREMLRALRPGGRIMVIGTGVRGGLGALLSRAQRGVPYDPLPLLEADGFRGGRRLGDAEGLVFFEAVKPRG